MHALVSRPLALAIGLAISSAAGAFSFSASDLDRAIAPCQDFNGFVNAKWLAANPVPADRSTWGTFEVLEEASLAAQHGIVDAAAVHAEHAKAGSIEQKIGWFYGAGMDEAAIDKLGDAPIKPTLAQIEALKTPEELVAWLRADFARGQGIPFRFGGRADYKNSTMTIAYAFQGGLGLPERDYYLKDTPDFQAKRKAYVAHIQRMLELAGTPAKAAAEQAQWVMAFETRLAKASIGRIEMRDPNNQYHFVSVADANKVTPNFDWAAFFTAQGADVKNGFSLSQPKFFAELDAMIASVPMTHWQAYLRYHTIDNAAPYLSKPFVAASFDFHDQTMRGQKEQKPRWKQVLSATNSELGMALGELYVAKEFSPESKAAALELVHNVAAALKTRIQNLDWMSAETKKKALEKWASFTPKIGYPDTWRDWSGLTLKPGDYFGNLLAAEKFNYDWNIAKIGKPVDRSEWHMTPQTVNAYYNATMNEIVFPAAILQAPFFDAKADDALNYGGIGAVIGHEMSHGYDDKGSQFDASGNFNNWWTDADRKAFDARTDKLVQQFDAYSPIDDLHVKGKLTLGENIADLGGLATAYDALQIALKAKPAEAKEKIDGFTEDQRFFLNWATVWRRNFRPEELKLRLNTDSHAPAMFRAIGAPSNMPAFAQAFDCKAGDKMVRPADERVKIW
ncbi:M13 family metallopeptidase [Dokdonella sp.]|uniref:M13 family metallopeptidase n=1 Tax=Dokdonella sp. TaxID=2291710 RepID=UPI0031BD07CC|nr:M13 family metallopeptidase [Dokdonella sp.]